MQLIFSVFFSTGRIVVSFILIFVSNEHMWTDKCAEKTLFAMVILI